MKLSKCTFGTLVCTKDRDGLIEKIGMVVGITNNAETERLQERQKACNAIPLVQFSCNKEPRGIHHGNLHLYKD